MLRFLARRILAGIPVLLLITLGTFLLIRLVPGGPFDFTGSKTTSPEVVAALKARYGLDKPLFLNLPSDGSVPDMNMEMRTTYPKLPLCDKLRQGLSASDAMPAEPADVSSGWYLLRMVEERRQVDITIGDRRLRCLETRSVLYSDLFRSQFFEYVDNALRLDFGLSLGKTTLGQPVSELIGDRLPVSFLLGTYSVIMGFLFGIPLGVVAALYRNSFIDYSITFAAAFFNSIPNLVLGPVLLIILVETLKILPGPNPQVWKSGNVLSWEFISRAILPISSLGIGLAAGLARLSRASLLQVMSDDYIRTARAKGLRERIVIYVHALKNAMIPVATIIGPLLAGALTGSLIVENIFAVPGLGSAFVDSITTRDYNLLTGVTILYSVFLILGNILVDVMYTWLDPRIRFD
jgi:oligopeptide transport system permease protein